jgi:hypothetical protein
MTIILVTTTCWRSRARTRAGLPEFDLSTTGPDATEDVVSHLYGCPVDLIAHGVPHRYSRNTEAIRMLSALFEYVSTECPDFGILASIVCGVIGVVIVEKKLVMMSGGIAHTAYGGVGLGYLLGFEPIVGAFAFSVLAALGIGRISRKGGARTDVVIALFWSFGMAMGILFIAFMKGYPPDLSHTFSAAYCPSPARTFT